MSPSLTAVPSGAMNEMVYLYIRSTAGQPIRKEAADWSWPVAGGLMWKGALTTFSTRTLSEREQAGRESATTR